MRCYICNSEILEGEVSFNRKYKEQRFGPIEPCHKCMAIIDDVFDDPLSEEEIDWLIENDEDDEDEEIFEVDQ
jgi:hypothetical protein